MANPEADRETRRALGAELAAYRRAAGHSQAQLARFTEYSRSTIANVETGRQHVPRDSGNAPTPRCGPAASLQPLTTRPKPRPATDCGQLRDMRAAPAGRAPGSSDRAVP